MMKVIAKTTMQASTQKQIKTLQTKAQKTADQLNQEVVVVAKGKQHIQVQAGTAYQLGAKDFDIKDANLIAKKIGNDLEISLEDKVVVFDDYFEVCATDLSCLVSLPIENGGLYHVLADIFFTLEDGTQVVYFYGEQSVVSTESSVTNKNTFQSPSEDPTLGLRGILTFFVAAVAVAGGGNDNNTDSFSLGGTFSAGRFIKGTNNVDKGTFKVEKAVFVYDKDGNQIANVDLNEDGTYTFSKDDLKTSHKDYTGTVYIRLKADANGDGTPNDIVFFDEATHAEAFLKKDLYSIATLALDAVTVHINAQTTIVTQVVVSGAEFTVDSNGKLIIGTGGSFAHIDAEKIARLEIVVRNALGLESNVFTTEVDTINSIGDEEGNVRAGQVAAVLSGAATTAGDFQAIINDIVKDIDSTGFLTTATADKLKAGAFKVRDKMNAEAAQAVAKAIAAAQAAQNAVDSDDGSNASALADKKATLATATALREKAKAEQIKINAVTKALVDTFVTSPITDAGFTLSADTGSNADGVADDFITKTTIQDITTTLATSLKTGESVWLSANEGTWVKGTVASDLTVTWMNANLGDEGTHNLRVVVSKTEDATQVDANNTSTIASKEYTLDTTAATVTSVVISATDSSDRAKTDTLIAGDKVIVNITMSEVVTMTASTDADKLSYKIMVGAVEKTATYVSGSGTNTLTFAYTITNNEADNVGGITAAANKLALTGSGSIIDIAGNTANLDSPAATTNTVTVDTQAPDAPTNLALNSADDTGASNSDNITKNTTVTITGKAEAGSTVELFNGTTSLGTSTADSSGNFTKQVTLPENANASITAIATDAVGNTGSTSTALSVTVDTTAATFSNGDTATGTGVTGQDITVYDAQAINMSGGTADDGITYTISGTDATKFDINADSGAVTYKTPPNAVTTKADQITITATDLAGNTSDQNVAISVVDRPIVTISSNKPDGTNDEFTLTFTFTEAVTGFELDDIIFGGAATNANITKGTLTTATSGDTQNKVFTLIITPKDALTDGNITVNIAADTVTGNVSGQGNVMATQFTQAFDETAPNAPTLSLTTDTGASDSDKITSDSAVTVSGLESGNTRAYALTKGSDVVADVNDATSYTNYMANAADASYKLTITDTDLAGNSSNSNELTFTLDKTASNAPSITLVSDTGSSSTDGVTNNGQVNVTGLETDATWQYSVNKGTDWTTGTNTSFTLAEGTYTADSIQVRQTDVAGNVSAAAKLTAITIDKSAPTFNNGVTAIDENSGAGQVIYTAVAKDDVGIARYELSGTDASAFSIDS
ncbi:MAG: Ig-like domain-containing protein, partial [Gammaproteobacteria bacterium]|nr:Ig-like domain-containing protein [Gammaproteobacteria bacterium]